MQNLYLFAAAIAKCALLTGIGPAIVFVYVAEKLTSLRRIPARQSNVVSIRKPRPCRVTARRSA